MLQQKVCFAVRACIQLRSWDSMVTICCSTRYSLSLEMDFCPCKALTFGTTSLWTTTSTHEMVAPLSQQYLMQMLEGHNVMSVAML